MFGLAGDDLTVVLFYVGLAVTFAVTAISIAGWRHRALIVTLFGFAAASLVVGGAWPWIKEKSPSVTGALKTVGTDPTAWFVVLMFFVAIIIFLKPQRTENGARSGAREDSYDDNELRRHINDLLQNVALLKVQIERTSALGDAIGQLNRTVMLLSTAAVDEMYRRRLEEALANVPPIPLDMPVDTDEKMTRETARVQEYLRDVGVNLSGSRWDQEFMLAIRRAEAEAESDLFSIDVPQGLHPARFRVFHIALWCRDRVEAFLTRSITAAKEQERQMLQLLKDRPEHHRRN